MRYRRLGNSEIEVSEIGLGCWTLGGLNWVNGVPNGWANVDEDEATRAIHYALDQGVTHFDNADVYGNGRAERMLAKGLDNRSKDVIIATKVGWFPGTAAHAYEPQHIRQQLEQSLVNLQREYVDIYYFHHGDFGKNDYYLDDAVEMVYRLRDEGKIRIIGQSAYSAEDFLRLVPKVRPTVIQSWANAIDDHFIVDGSPVANLLRDWSMSFVAFSPLAKGLLLNKYSAKNPPRFKAGDHRQTAADFKLENIMKVEQKMAKVVARFGSEAKQLSRFALQYLLSFPVVGSVIPGFRNRQQVEANLWGADLPLSSEDIKFIQDVFRG